MGKNIHYRDGVSLEELKKWLRENIECARITDMGRDGLDRNHKLVFSIHFIQRKVYLLRPEDQIHFALTWT